LKLGGAFLFGLVVTIIAVIAFVLGLPYILPFLRSMATGIYYVLLAILVFIIIWAVVFGFTFLGVVVYYLFKPMKVSERPKGYTIKKAKEAGRRQKNEEEE
jgi:membrane protein implicated in regulation of membrane protease activity